jgi:hypothetical protein
MNLPKTLKIPQLASVRVNNIFSENQSTRAFFDFESRFQNCFLNLLISSGLSQICKIRNVWKLPCSFSKNTLIPSSEKTSWSMKTIILEEKLSIKFRNGHENFSGVIVSMVLGLLA